MTEVSLNQADLMGRGGLPENVAEYFSKEIKNTGNGIQYQQIQKQLRKMELSNVQHSQATIILEDIWTGKYFITDKK